LSTGSGRYGSGVAFLVGAAFVGAVATLLVRKAGMDQINK